MDENKSQYITEEEHQRIIAEYQGLASHNRQAIVRLSRVTTWILSVLVVIQLIIGGLSVILLSRTGSLGTANHDAIARIDRESSERIQQSCLRTEREYKDRVAGLTTLYNFVESLTPAEKKQPFNALIIKQIPKSEQDAKLAVAPKYCDAPGVGLDESPMNNPPLPKRPPDLNVG